MRTGETARLDLLQGLEELLGRERATTLMAYLPPVADVATRDDVRALGGRVEEQLAATEQRFLEQLAATDKRLSEQLAATEERFREQLAATDKRLSERIAACQESLSHQIASGDHSVRASLREEMNRLISSQTRAIVFALVGAITANASLVLLAT